MPKPQIVSGIRATALNESWRSHDAQTFLKVTGIARSCGILCDPVKTGKYRLKFDQSLSRIKITVKNLNLSQLGTVRQQSRGSKSCHSLTRLRGFANRLKSDQIYTLEICLCHSFHDGWSLPPVFFAGHTGLSGTGTATAGHWQGGRQGGWFRVLELPRLPGLDDLQKSHFEDSVWVP